MRRYGKNFRRSAPFIRLLAALIIGILIQHYFDLPLMILAISACVALPGWLFIRFARLQQKFSWSWIGGTSIYLFLVTAGAALVYARDTRRQLSWIGYHLDSNSVLLATLTGTLTEKAKSFKSTAALQGVYHRNRWSPVTGTIMLYFKKENLAGLQEGSQLIIHKLPQSIAGSGNPGAFDYGRYCASQGIYHQLYLQQKDYCVLPAVKGNASGSYLQAMRNIVLGVLKKYIPGEKESGVAEALLIGYRDDLDKDLVQAYSNTGVVHIIAISGLHLGMIYGLLLMVFKPFRRARWTRIAKPVFILIVLWGFTLLTGAAASILRSAVMFSFIILGESLGRKTQIYNTLAASAFCLLAYDPNLLWDVGFQLSYAAVLSIVIFMKPIYRQIYCQNKLLHMVWELNSVTLAAQILTLPLILFYFHQFPNLFLFTNFIAVPLSGFILYGELLLLLFSQVPVINVLTGRFTSFMISHMNGVIERTDRLPFGVTGNIRFTFTQAVLLYACLAGLGYFLLNKKRSGFLSGCSFMLLLIIVTAAQQITRQRQHLLIVYNVPRRAAMDVVEGQHYLFRGDSVVQLNKSLLNFHLRPGRALFGVFPGRLTRTIAGRKLLCTRRVNVLLIDPSFRVRYMGERIKTNLVVLSHGPQISVTQLAAMFDCPQYVFDSSNPLWKIREWKKQCDSLHLRHHSVPEQGAFQMAL